MAFQFDGLIFQSRNRIAGFSHYAIIYELMAGGYLYTPSEEEKKRICTLIYIK